MHKLGFFFPARFITILLEISQIATFPKSGCRAYGAKLSKSLVDSASLFQEERGGSAGDDECSGESNLGRVVVSRWCCRGLRLLLELGLLPEPRLPHVLCPCPRPVGEY